MLGFTAMGDNYSQEETNEGIAGPSDTRYGLELVLPVSNARKRKRCPHQWKRAILQKQRYQPKAFPKLPACKHPVGKLKCPELSMQDIRRIHQKYYQEHDRVKQNNFILQHVRVTSPKK